MSRQRLENLISFVICFIMMGLAVFVAKCCSKDQYIRNIYTYGLTFSNFGFMGNAVVSIVFPNMFVDYLIFTMPLWVMIYMWGVPCLLIPSEGEKQTIKSRLKSFANPMCVAMIIGITVANMDFKKVLSLKSIYIVSFVRLIVFPLIFIGIFILMPMSQTIMVSTICSLAMPLGLSTIVVPGGYGKDTSVAAGMTIVSHLLSVITIPSIFYIMMNML